MPAPWRARQARPEQSEAVGSRLITLALTRRLSIVPLVTFDSLAFLPVPALNASPDPKAPTSPADSAAAIAVPAVTTRGLFLAGLMALAVWILWGFLPALAWAAVLAIAVEPLVQRVHRRIGAGHDTAIAAVVSLVFLLLLVVPLVFGITEAARESAQLHQAIRDFRLEGIPAPGWLAGVPGLGAWLGPWWHDHLGSPEAAGEIVRRFNPGQWLAQTRTIGADLVHRLVLLGFTWLALFLLLRHRAAVTAQARLAAAKLLGPSARRIGDQAVASVRGTIDGLVLVGIGEGVVMTLAYLLLGVPHPILLGVVTAVAAIVPFGAAIAFGLAGVLLLTQGSVGAAAAVVAIGLTVVALADHLVRPALIGGATRLPFLWVLLGILGGVERLGLIGLFVGPATMAVLFMLWREFVGEEPARATEREAP